MGPHVFRRARAIAPSGSPIRTRRIEPALSIGGRPLAFCAGPSHSATSPGRLSCDSKLPARRGTPRRAFPTQTIGEAGRQNRSVRISLSTPPVAKRRVSHRIRLVALAGQQQLRAGREVVEVLAQLVLVQIVDFFPAAGLAQLALGDVE